jgi:pilus assembly protein Flp/PilA
MQPGCLRLVFRLQCLLMREDGQDLVEYALLVAMLAAAVTASQSSFAAVITQTFNHIATTFTNAL